ncbi:MAG: FeoB small GTPase domain-containing protein [Campylobacterales bacterium]
MKIVLMGNPNVGKSALFARLTGVDVMVSNYPGTTIELKKGKMRFEGRSAEVIDVPGTYSLSPASKAEAVAIALLKEADLVINVVDATNLERNLYLTLQLLERNIPVIVVLNFWDERRHVGIRINREMTGEGVRELVSRLGEARVQQYRFSEQERWAEIGAIVKAVQQVTRKKHTFLERLEDLSIEPLTGIPITLAVLFFVFWTVRLAGETLIAFLFDPIFEAYRPLVTELSGRLGGGGLLHDILVGSLIDGRVDYVQSMGLLTTGLYVPFAMVLPYVFVFYAVLGVLEDSGYLPRLATLVAAMVAVPCMAQTAMVFALLGPYGVTAFGIYFSTLFAVWVVLGLVLNRVMKGETPETFMEIPPYRIPYAGSLAKKLWMRMRRFFGEAIPFVLLGVLIVNLLYVSGAIAWIGAAAEPVVTGVFGLPKEAAASLVAGFLRKDVAVGMLLPLGLDMGQLIVASVVLTMYFPCVATFAVLFRELGAKDLVKATGIMLLSALGAGGLLNVLL